MKEAQRKYKTKCKQRVITFYPNEEVLYEVSKMMNFQAFVKDCLKQATVALAKEIKAGKGNKA